MSKMIHVKILDLCTFFCNALENIPNKIVRLPILFLGLTYLPKLQSWNMFKTSATFNPNFPLFSEINTIEK